jgi:hypothetical protein
MTDRRSPNPARLGEIRRLARNAEAAETSAPRTAARKRRRFGPLLYSTLVLAAICIFYLGALWLEELADSAGRRPIKVDPEEQAGAALAKLAANTWQPRMEGAKELGDLLRIHGPGDERSAVRRLADPALRRALGDQAGPVRAAAAVALGVTPQTARAAKNELIAALKDEDITVRLPAAQALLTIGDDSKTLALGALAQLVADMTPLPERLASLDSMARARQRPWRRSCADCQTCKNPSVSKRSAAHRLSNPNCCWQPWNHSLSQTMSASAPPPHWSPSRCRCPPRIQRGTWDR